MVAMRYAAEADKAFWFTLDGHISEDEFLRKVRDRRGYIIHEGDASIGVLRYNLFWDSIPFLTMIYLSGAHRGKGMGKAAVQLWEAEMRGLGYAMVMTSTQVDEQAQHFYRKLGYAEKGGICFDNTPLVQPMEMIMVKRL